MTTEEPQTLQAFGGIRPISGIEAPGDSPVPATSQNPTEAGATGTTNASARRREIRAVAQEA
jgi:hypothetical protein